MVKTITKTHEIWLQAFTHLQHENLREMRVDERKWLRKWIYTYTGPFTAAVGPKKMDCAPPLPPQQFFSHKGPKGYRVVQKNKRSWMGIPIQLLLFFWTTRYPLGPLCEKNCWGGRGGAQSIFFGPTAAVNGPVYVYIHFLNHFLSSTLISLRFSCCRWVKACSHISCVFVIVFTIRESFLPS